MVDAADGRVHVAIDYTITNNKPNTATVIYYYRTVSLGVQADARAVRATDRSGALGVSTVRHRHFTEVEVRLRANLYYDRTTSFTVRYDLVGAQPRSETPTRVGRAFVTFSVWGFGDHNAGTVEVRLPAGFTSSVEGDAMDSTSGSGGTVLRASPAEPESFFAIVTGENRSAFDDERLSLPGGAEIVVLSWPEDDRWAETVSDALERGIPDLQALVGLDWPVTHDLTVRERYTPALEGYAGIFFTDDQRIDVSEDLDPVTILHEASHAWFNDSLFADRWIYEGLAEEYAWRVNAGNEGSAGPLPEPPHSFDPGWQLLGSWKFPEVIRDEDTQDAELYGYGASFWVIHQVVEAVGVDQMREAFEAAEANTTAYPGAGPPESVALRDDWRRFLDLVEPPDQVDAPAIEEAFRAWVVAAGETHLLADRNSARRDYRALLEHGKGWLPPWQIRELLGVWRFDEAMAAMDEAGDVLELRDKVDEAATAEGLTSGDALEAAYEGAADGFGEATSLANQELEALRAIAEARAVLDDTPDLVAGIGRIGEPEPSVPYQAARAAFVAGNLTAAIEQAAKATSIVGRAPILGQERLILGAVILVALLAFVVLVVVVRRRRSRRAIGVEPGSAALLALDARFAPGTDALLAAPEPADPSGTLGADPDRPPTPLGEAPPDEGGPART